MRSLNRKLVRDLWHMRGMVVVIAMMVTSGAATFITLLSTLQSLRSTQEAYYEDYQFAHVFVSLKRAPNGVVQQIREISGVNRVQARIQAGVNLDVEGFDETVQGLIYSLPDEGEPLLNRLYLREGRYPAPYNEDEVIVGDGFAEAHGFHSGDALKAVINGKLKELRIVGVGLSPEFIFQGQPGSMSPDLKRFGILWMRRSALEAAYDMSGAFNNVVLSITRRTEPLDVIRQLDLILDRYGGTGAIARENQQSHFFITEEFRQLKQTATIIPFIFIGVAAFLLSVVIGRLVRTQKVQIAILKAFGYTNREVAFHYLLFVTVILILGLAGGVWLGIYLGEQMSALYAEYYRFPYIDFKMDPLVFLGAVAITSIAGYSGVLRAVRQAFALPPAEAMRPEQPILYSRSRIEHWGLAPYLDQPTKMILRQLSRHPLKAVFSIVGIGFAASLVMVGRMSNDSVKYSVEVEFRQAQPFDLGVTFIDGVSDHTLMEIRRIPGVQYVEGGYGVPVRLYNGHREYLTSIQGYTQGQQLHRIVDKQGNKVSIPRSGLLMTQELGDILKVQPGDTLRVKLLEGDRKEVELPVVAFMNQYFGLSCYMNIEELHRLLNEPRVVNAAYLQVDETYYETIVDELQESPMVGEIIETAKLIQRFYDSTAQTWLIMALFVSLLAGATAFSVVYNNARIALSERNRELASLRVLGFTRGEISYILLGELTIVVLLAIPLGFVLGWGLTAFLIWSLQTELYRIPMSISLATYTLSAVTVLASALVSAVVVRIKLNRLDLIGVLKTRE
jgi:putative ABC transport system permease protein